MSNTYSDKNSEISLNKNDNKAKLDLQKLADR